MDDITKQWEALCKEQAQKRDAYFKAHAIVIEGFTAVYHGQPEHTPSLEQLTASKRAHDEWQEAVERMRKFTKEHI